MNSEIAKATGSRDISISYRKSQADLREQIDQLADGMVIIHTTHFATE